jgi:UDP-N-acetyl-D-mannosaminuronate dehydrogenase
LVLQGLIGLLTAQLLVTNGCRVIGVDIDESKLELSRLLSHSIQNQVML